MGKKLSKNMWHFVLLLLVFITNQLNCVNGANEYCFSNVNHTDLYNHFATKTAYSLMTKNKYFNGLDYQSPECQATKLWFLSRHGTRYPDQDFVEMKDLVIELVNKIRNNPNKSKLCQPDAFFLKSWKNWKFTKENAEKLGENAKNDIINIAGYFKQQFPSLFRIPLTQDKYLFSSSNTNRTIESLKIFVKALLDKTLNENELMPLSDTFLTPHETCEAFKQQHLDDKNNEESQINKLEKSDLINKLVSDVSDRLGFPVTRKEIYVMWDLCRFEQALQTDRNSYWCATLLPEQVNVLEFREDLKYFYKFGYGHEMNSKMACATMQDMLKTMEKNDGPTITAYYSHSAIIQLFLNALGAFQDDQPLKYDEYDKSANRKWQTSKISPFTANIAVIKYECPPNSENDPKVQFLLNQEPINIGSCKNGTCEWSYLKKRYEEFYSAECSSYYCSSSTKKSISLHILSISSFVLYLMYYLILQI